MDETTSKGLSLTAVIFITIGLITLGVIIFSIVVAAVKTGQEKMTGLTDTLQQTEYSTYDNGNMSGSQVLNAVRQYMKQDEFGVTVITGKGGSTTYGNTFDGSGVITSSTKNTFIAPAQNQADPNYINPSGKFRSRIVPDANGVVRGIIFTQPTN